MNKNEFNEKITRTHKKMCFIYVEKPNFCGGGASAMFPLTSGISRLTTIFAAIYYEEIFTDYFDLNQN